MKLYRGQCVDDAQAVDAFYSSADPVISGNPPTLFLLEKNLVGWHLNGYQSGSLTTSVLAPVPSLADCDPGQSALDGIALGFAVAAVFIVAWAARTLIYIIRGGV